MTVFMRIVSMKSGYGIVFMCIVTFKIIFSIKRYYRNDDFYTNCYF